MYNVVTIKMLRSEFMANFYFSKSQVNLAKQFNNDGNYKVTARIEFPELDDVSDEDLLEEVFDLTNNPARQDERDRRYGRGRSVSVGDIVIVNGDEYVCQSMGWAKLY